MIKIKKIHPEAIMPKYVRPKDAAFDIYSIETKDIMPNQRVLISTGIIMAIPEGYVGLIWDRSGLAAKDGIITLGGVIDCTYRGEIKIILHNLSSNTFTVEKGTRIAQMLIQPVVQKVIIEVSDLDDTVRGEGGFGSSGMR